MVDANAIGDATPEGVAGESFAKCGYESLVQFDDVERVLRAHLSDDRVGDDAGAGADLENAPRLAIAGDIAGQGSAKFAAARRDGAGALKRAAELLPE